MIDTDGDTASIRFAWAVSPGSGDLAPTFGAGTVAANDCIVSRTIQNLTVPAATGGDGTLTYTIENLPDGVSVSTARVVSGTPSTTGSGTATVTAEDGDGDFATLAFDWTVYAPAPVLSANPNPSTTSHFTVRWSAFRTNDQDYFLVETAPGGGTKSYTVDINAPKQFIAKPDGTHSYQMTGCRAVYDRDTQAQVYRCTDLGNALTVTVDGPEPDTVAKQLNYTYTAHAGDFDNNTHTDLLIKRTSSGVGAGIFRTVILSQKTMGQFTLVAPSETEVMTASAYPVASNVSLVLGDYNLDGFVDILLRGLSTAITGALDRIVYAPGGKTGGHPTALNAVDEDFTKFLTQTTSWIRDNDYFDSNAVTMPVASTGITVLYHCQESETGNNYYADYPCPFHDTPIGEIHQPFVNVVNVISYAHFNQDALAFSRQFSLVDGRINPNVTLGSQQAKNLSQILKRVFGTQILNGQLEKSCTGLFSYDSQLSIPCNDEYLLGRALMQTATETLNDVDPTTGTNERRALTGNEKTIAQENGLGLTATELGLIEVVNAGDIIQGSPDAACQVLPSDKYVIQCIDSIYSSMPADLMLHELAHVAQVAYAWPSSAPADWQFDDNGDVSLDKKYVYRNPTSSNTQQRELLYDEFSNYTWEQQAELLQDRHRACKQNQLEYNSDNKTKDHEDFIRNGRIDTTAHDAYLKKIYDGIDGISGMPVDSGSCRWETVRANAPTIH